jgi:hypothetical protein
MSASHPSPSQPRPDAKQAEILRLVSGPGGFEIPVIDLSHPAFSLDPSEEELARAMAATVAYVRRLSRMPPFARKISMALALRGSRLAAAAASARSGYLGGMATYLLKLGPDCLGSWANGADRAVASSFPCYSARLRMRDAASLIAEEIGRMRGAQGGSRIRLVGIAGGPSMEIVNALIFARRRFPGFLEGREIRIDSLDIDAEGAAFGARALEALLSEGGALHGLDARMRGVVYDWDDAKSLAAALGPGRSSGEGARGETVFSSEGGLFDYASDESVSANLRAIGELAGRGAAMVGTMSVAEGEAGIVNGASGAALRLRRLTDFEALAAGAGWMIEDRLERPLSRCFLLRRS